LTWAEPEIYRPRVPPYGRIDRDYGKQLRSSAADGPIYMLNLTRYRPDVPHGWHGVGRFIGRDPGASYAPLDVFADVGARLCFVAAVVASPGNWNRVFVVGYPSRRSFVAMAARHDFMNWHHDMAADIEEVIVMGILPIGMLPSESTSWTLLETWSGPRPAPVAPGPVTEFAVEGTLIGDGRQWSGARYTAIEPGTPLPLDPTPPGYDALLLEPTVERWR
jgi:hypothetical protein